MKQNPMQTWWQNSYLFDGSAPYIENLYENYLAQPESVPQQWRECFDKLPKKNGAAEISHESVRDHFRQLARQPVIQMAPTTTTAAQVKEAAVMRLIQAYRLYGHRIATLDPLGLTESPKIPALEPAYYSLTVADLDTVFQTNLVGNTSATLRIILAALQKTYCGNIGVEYLHITNTQEAEWLQRSIETAAGTPKFDTAIKRRLLQQLIAADGLEKYLGAKYVGQTRFSLEGGDSLIPQLDELIQRAGRQGIQEIVIGMAHRGRLNVLINVLGKSPGELFSAFEGKYHDVELAGDVKYHLGFSSDLAVSHGALHLSLVFNPSHLEAINPVVEGSVRARQDRRGNGQQVMPILIHGDAALAGQGIVMETLNMSQTRGFGTGGTLHLIINNQIGFTTSDPHDARSTFYCSDIAKMLEIPVFHVNADDVEAVLLVTEIALDYRMKFKKDVFIDLVCYRRYGHNEADEPSATQPVMYQTIRSHKTPREIYAEQLIAAGIVSAQEVTQMQNEYRDKLDSGESIVKTVKNNSRYAVDWTPYLHQRWEEPVKTGLPLKQLQELGQRLAQLPAGFIPQAQVKKELDARNLMTAGELPLNWGAAETLAYASLLDEKIPVRLCGQDSGRGTFSHRHAMLHDHENGKCYTPLNHISADQAKFTVIDSLLSEAGVVGFEYGYASTSPATLVLWEAQYGDFANSAQVIIDQFISSSEVKWGRLCGLVLLLPHGYEGAGPEHSSARLERFLQLCAQENMQVCMPSTPAQIFHLLRRQMLRPYRKPLIVMTPKSLLRHKLAVSNLEELVTGAFQTVIPETDALKLAARRVIFCSGKIYYDLLAKRRANKQEDIAIVRVEQFYPVPQQALVEEMQRYINTSEIVWCQEEPKNQGAWTFMQDILRSNLKDQQQLTYIGREASASPATGSSKLHQQQQIALVDEALK